MGEAVKHNSAKQDEAKKTELALDGPLTTLYEMVRLTMKGERIWSGKLFKNLRGKDTTEGKLNDEIFARSMHILSETGVVVRYTGETERNKAGFLLRINDSEFIRAALYYKEYLKATGAPEMKVSDQEVKEATKRREEYEESRNLISLLRERSRQNRQKAGDSS
jgi:hypothetical protein